MFDKIKISLYLIKNCVMFAYYYRLRKYPDAVYWINAAIPMPVLTAEVNCL